MGRRRTVRMLVRQHSPYVERAPFITHLPSRDSSTQACQKESRLPLRQSLSSASTTLRQDNQNQPRLANNKSSMEGRLGKRLLSKEMTRPDCNSTAAPLSRKEHPRQPEFLAEAAFRTPTRYWCASARRNSLGPTKHHLGSSPHSINDPSWSPFPALTGPPSWRR